MSIQDSPHVEVSSAELAAWVERRGATTMWWTADGDRYLAARMGWPCRGDELAAILRRANRSALVADPRPVPGPAGRVVTAADLDALTRPVALAVHGVEPAARMGTWAYDRALWMCWKGEESEWVLAEDSDTAEAFRDTIIEPRLDGW